MEKKDLLSELAELQGCKYLSDLKYQHDNRLYDTCLDLLNSGTRRFTKREWEECICYLNGGKVTVNSFEEVEMQLNRMKEHDQPQNTMGRREYDEK